jgi:hypothetical protein
MFLALVAFLPVKQQEQERLIAVPHVLGTASFNFFRRKIISFTRVVQL